MGLDAALVAEALRRIAVWRSDPSVAVACPKCGAAGLLIEDHSARPYAEWYRLACGACGLDETIHIPLGPPVMGGME